MIDLPVYNTDGKEVDTIRVDENLLGGRVRYKLLKQAIVAYEANKHLKTATTKGRSDKAGSGKKLYRQKGTGFARVGNRRTGKRVGGGVTFAKSVRDSRQRLPKKQRKLARDSAVLAKMVSDDVVVVDGMKFEQPKTSEFASVLDKLNIDRGCVVAVNDFDEAFYKSARNIPRVSVMSVTQLNAGDVCSRRKLLFTRDAIESFLNREKAEIS